MEKKLHYLLMSLVFINVGILSSQTTEDFEGEAIASSSFIDNGQTFNVTSPTTGETYDIFNCAGCGWNGTTTDAQFIENSAGANGANNGSSFTIKSNDGTDIIVSNLYLFCSTLSLSNHSGSLTITGKKEGVQEFTFTKDSGFSNVDTLTPNNGFTYINFITEGAADYSQTPIDELIFTSTTDLDYMALDAFTWDYASTLSIEDLSNIENNVTIYPNPSSDDIQISNIRNITQYEIYNILGERIRIGNINPNQKINITELNIGIYILKLEGSNTIKFVKK